MTKELEALAMGLLGWLLNPEITAAVLFGFVVGLIWAKVYERRTKR